MFFGRSPLIHYDSTDEANDDDNDNNDDNENLMTRKSSSMKKMLLQFDMMSYFCCTYDFNETNISQLGKCACVTRFPRKDTKAKP